MCFVEVYVYRNAPIIPLASKQNPQFGLDKEGLPEDTIRSCSAAFQSHLLVNHVWDVTPSGIHCAALDLLWATV